MSCAIPELGGLPLLMLHAYVPVIIPVIQQILNSPSDDQAWRQLRRALYTHATIVQRRRAGDRRKKEMNGVRYRRLPCDSMPDSMGGEQRGVAPAVADRILSEESVSRACGFLQDW